MRRTLTALILLIATATARAHTLPVTGVIIHTGPHATSVAITVHLPLLAGADPATTISPRLHLRLDGLPFHPTHIQLIPDPQADTITWSASDPHPATTIALDAPIFPDHPEDTTAVLIYTPDTTGQDHLTARMLLTPTHPAATTGEPLLTTLRRFVVMGILHILSGPDHILFVLGLILAGGTLRQLLGLLTAFTLAHSITLSLTALGLATLSPRIVEPIIALSIVAVGLENLYRQRIDGPATDYPLRITLAFGFGFFHGFGFAGALTEAGLPQQAIGWSLAAFNLGVELGQGTILLAVLPILHAITRYSPTARQRTTRYASILIAIAGAIWFLQRIEPNVFSRI
jgi:hydrogenase/urease accessory protein HupE